MTRRRFVDDLVVKYDAKVARVEATNSRKLNFGSPRNFRHSILLTVSPIRKSAKANVDFSQLNHFLNHIVLQSLITYTKRALD